MGSGTYVVAVSGGVDSMVLLDLLRQRPGVKLVVAHFDHGIRPDSHEDRKLVQDVAKRHGLTFVQGHGKLGKTASEATAREARYTFLHNVKEASGAKAIITAHHQDDLVETALLNIVRGTGRRGLTSLKSTDGIVRPLLDYDKVRIRDHAHNHKLAWREDSTNSDTKYLRNYLRLNIMPKLTPSQRAQVVILLNDLLGINDEIDAHMINLLHAQPGTHELNRAWFINLPHDVAREVVHAWLRHRGASELNRKLIEQLVVAMKTTAPGKRLDVDKHLELALTKDTIALKKRSTSVKPRIKKPTKAKH